MFTAALSILKALSGQTLRYKTVHDNSYYGDEKQEEMKRWSSWIFLDK